MMFHGAVTRWDRHRDALQKEKAQARQGARAADYRVDGAVDASAENAHTEVAVED